jgi:hypothetical protein
LVPVSMLDAEPPEPWPMRVSPGIFNLTQTAIGGAGVFWF